MPLVQTLPLLEGVPESYTPGDTITFQVGVPRLADFTSYTINMIFITDGVDPALTVSAAFAQSNYPFPVVPATNPDDAVAEDGDNQIRLTVSDSTDSGVLAVPPTNNSLFTVKLVTGSTLRGTIRFEVNGDFEHSGEDPPYPPPQNQPIEITQNSVDGGNPVPAPPGVLLAGLGALLLAARTRFRSAYGRQREGAATPISCGPFA